jgi:hypothetical protein
MNDGLERMWKEAVVAYLKVLVRLFSGGTEQTTKNLSLDSWSSGRDLNPGPRECEAGVLTTRPRRSVKFDDTVQFSLNSDKTKPFYTNMWAFLCAEQTGWGTISFPGYFVTMVTLVIMIILGYSQTSRLSIGHLHRLKQILANTPKLLLYASLSQSSYPGGTLEIIFRSQGTPA